MMLIKPLESNARYLGIGTQLLPAENVSAGGELGDTERLHGCRRTVHGERHFFLRDNRE
jgi:hypothetical protein